ncbi:uncharacterized protein LOC143879860 [Tasmannia lanceolata]|uniref:uncharacterized protein LOC143879860 n=1 Tax=Tasmannia lanceolata TaxID=3420 RepID=UPI004063454E
MAKPLFFPLNLEGMYVGSEEFWGDTIRGGWATIIVLLFLFLWQFRRAFTRPLKRDLVVVPTTISPNGNSTIGISEIISDDDLRNLVNNLERKVDEKEKWDDVIDRRNNLMSYKAKCCKPKDAPLKYLSVTTFENCSTKLLRDFYMDNEYRIEWDKILVEHEQLQIDEISGMEVGRTIKKFPLLTPREYVLAWRVWEGKEKTFYCFIKDCEHALAPRRKKFVRVGVFRSGWRIRKVHGRDACEITMVHQEDASLNVEMTKLAFAKGIWSYVCKMDNALRRYSSIIATPSSSTLTALKLIRKVPPELETGTEIAQRDLPESSVVGEFREKKLSKRPSKKLIANGLLVVGGIICLSRGHASIGVKLAMACILKKLTKHGATPRQAMLR